jgi:hypothetical protein
VLNLSGEKFFLGSGKLKVSNSDHIEYEIRPGNTQEEKGAKEVLLMVSQKASTKVSGHGSLPGRI